MAGSSPAPRTPGEVEHHGSHGQHRAPAMIDGISEVDEPSVEWGWHGRYRKLAQFAGFAVAGVLLILLWGNHDGRIEDLWLILLAIGMAALSVRSIVKERTSWRR